jgi:hypothetical protein|tara:strand:- start:6379 stop:6594 length:216 start_codon:yes stop_codon:yes gene_type:complete
MNYSNKCTLIINAYNQAKQLDLQLESALKQLKRSLKSLLPMTAHRTRHRSHRQQDPTDFALNPINLSSVKR